MTNLEEQSWRSVYVSYNKDQTQLDQWVKQVVKAPPEEVLTFARQFTDIHLPSRDAELNANEMIPQALTLGFSPQVLVGILSLRGALGENISSSTRKVTVITSPEVTKGTIPPARHSHQILKHFAEYLEVQVTPLVPSERLSAMDVVNSMSQVLKAVNASILDISGGTQLVPLAALQAGVTWVTYGYPNGNKLVFYPFKLKP